MRAMFEDMIPGEVLRNAAPLLAKVFYPLLLCQDSHVGKGTPSF